MTQGTKNKKKKNNKTGGLDPKTHTVKFRVDFRSLGTAILPGQCAKVWDLRDPWCADEKDERLVVHMASAVYKEGALCIDERFPVPMRGGIGDVELSAPVDSITSLAELMYPSGVATWRKGFRPCLPSPVLQKPLTVGLWQRAEGYTQAEVWDPSYTPYWGVKDDNGFPYFDPVKGEIVKICALKIPFVTAWETVEREGIDFFSHYSSLLSKAAGKEKEVYLIRPGHVDQNIVGPGEPSYEGVYQYPAFSGLNWPELSCDFFGDRFHRWLQTGVLEGDADPNPIPQHANGVLWF